MLRGWYTDQWWNKITPDVDCSADEIKQAAGSYLAVEEIIFSTTPNTSTVAGLVRLLFFGYFSKLVPSHMNSMPKSEVKGTSATGDMLGQSLSRCKTRENM